MVDYTETRLEHIVISYVGNKILNEPLVTSEEIFIVQEDLENILKKYFLSYFKPEIFFEIFHSSNIENN